MNNIRKDGSDDKTQAKDITHMSGEDRPNDKLNDSKSLDNLIDNLPIQPLRPYKKRRNLPRWPFIALACFGVLTVITIVAGLAWYQAGLQAVNPASDKLVKLNIPSGSSSRTIAEQLKRADIIKNETAFYIYVRLNGVASELQSGSYRLSPADNVEKIVEHLKNGRTDTFRITFLPGDTLKGHRQALIDAGYKAEVVDSAFNGSYDHQLIASKPRTANLEGYIYGETYEFQNDASVESILMRTFDEMQSVIKENSLESKYEKMGLSLYEGIILASIIQKEEKVLDNQKKVSQVFHLRLKKGMPLGSDPTYQYAADQEGVARDPGLDSPYNTRIITGLPPGPISSPGESALIAAAEPAQGDYLYFLSGDDDMLYFGRSNAEHEKNIRDHCQQKCKIL